MATKTIKYLSAESLPSLITKIKEKIVAAETAAKLHADTEISKLPTSENIRAIAVEEAAKAANEKVAEIVGGAPEALDTLNELAEALGNDKDFSATVLGKIGENKDAITAVEGSVDTLSGTVGGHTSSISQINGSITAINNSLKDKADITAMNTAISNATKDMATTTSVNTAISNATKDMATNTSVNTAISNATKDFATTSAMNTAIGNATKDLATAESVTALQGNVANCLTESNFVEIGETEINKMINDAFAATTA